MMYATKELLKNGETQYSIKKKVRKNLLFPVARGIYSSEPSSFVNEAYICKKYPYAVLTGLSAFSIYNLTDQIPDKFYLATEQHSFPIRRNDVVQSYQDSSFFGLGIVSISFDSGTINIFDLERTLIELIRLKEKFPPDLYYEVLNSFRKIKHRLDFYKINQYIKGFKNGKTLILKIKEMI